MGHSVTGFIVHESHAHKVHEIDARFYAAPLEQGFVLFPLTDDLLDQIFPSSGEYLYEEFTYLCASLSTLLLSLSASSLVLYFETDYFGGIGQQAAIVYDRGKVVFGPKSGEIGPINEALTYLGVTARSGKDQFDSVGLGKHRHTEDWFTS